MKKHFFKILLILVAIGFLTRLGTGYELYRKDSQVANPLKVTDMATYQTLSHEVETGRFPKAFDYQPFYYTVFLPAIYFVFGRGHLPVLIAQCLLGTATIWLAAICAARIFGRKTGIYTAIILIPCNMLILYTPYYLIAPLQTFWLVLIFWLTIKAVTTMKWPYWLLTGLATGCAILTRGNAWLLVPGLLFIAIYYSLKKYKSSEKHQSKIKKQAVLLTLPTVLLLLFILIPQIPFAWHNTEITGKLCGASVAGGKVLALGNTPEAPPGGRNPGHGPGPMEYPPTFNAWMSNKTPVIKQIMNWALSEPLAFIELNFRKLLLFWDHREIPNNIAPEVNGAKSVLINYTGFIPTSIIMILALAGIISSVPKILKNKLSLILIYFIISYWLATAAFYILARFRVPIIPFLAIFAAAYVHNLVVAVQKHNKKTVLLKFGLPLLVSGFLCVYSYDSYRYYFEPGIIRIAKPNGVRQPLNTENDMYLDNGPFTFGGWERVEFTPGTMISKKFNLLNKTYKSAQFAFPILWSSPGFAIVSVNGHEKNIKSQRPGMNEVILDLPPPPDGQINIKLIQTNTPIFALADRQRNYDRTTLNLKNYAGELICRLYCFTENP